MHTLNLKRFMVICAAVVVAAGTASAGVTSYQGVFGADSQTETFSFVAGTSGVVIQTYSYAGGFNASGQFIPRGGFDPLLSLFGPGPGNVLTPLTPLIGTNDDGVGANVDSFTGAAFDSVLDTTAASIVLIPGRTYFLVISQSGNFPNSNLYGGGFSGVNTGLFGCSNGQFCDVTADNRDGHWALSISGALLSFNTSNPLPQAPNPFNFPLITGLGSPSVTSEGSGSGDSGSAGTSGSGGSSGDSGSPGGTVSASLVSDPNNPAPSAPSGCTAPCGGNGGTSDDGTSGNGDPAGPGVQALSAGDVSGNAVPTPEPASVILFGAGIAALLVRRRLVS